MITEEARRVLFHEYGFIIIIGFLAVHFLLLVKDNNILYAKTEEQISKCILEWSGSFDKDKYDDFVTIVNELNDNGEDALKSYKELKEGRITYPEYVIACQAYNERSEKRFVYTNVMHMVDYVYEKPEKRQLIYQKGWERLFIYDNHLLLTIPLLLIYLSIFTSDAGSRVRLFQATSVFGRRKLAENRWVLAVLFTALVVFLKDSISLIYYSVIYGLPHPEYSLQSLQQFEEYTGDLSLGMAYLYKMILEILACLVIAGVIVAVTSVTDSRYMGTFTGILMVLESLIISDNETTNKLILYNCFSLQQLLAKPYHMFYPLLCLLICIISLCVSLLRNPERRAPYL